MRPYGIPILRFLFGAIRRDFFEPIIIKRRIADYYIKRV